jgi:hypothetical protein
LGKAAALLNHQPFFVILVNFVAPGKQVAVSIGKGEITKLTITGSVPLQLLDNRVWHGEASPLPTLDLLSGDLKTISRGEYSWGYSQLGSKCIQPHNHKLIISMSISFGMALKGIASLIPGPILLSGRYGPVPSSDR